MSEVAQPDWMQGFSPAPRKGNPAWVKNGPSPNPRGRPPGIVDKRQKLQNAFADEAVAIAKVVISAALDGDMQAANIALARLAAPLKAQAERVQFELSRDAPLSEQASQILVAVSEGKLDAETGRTLIGCIQAVSGIKAVEELEHRLIILEARSV